MNLELSRALAFWVLALNEDKPNSEEGIWASVCIEEIRSPLVGVFGLDE